MKSNNTASDKSQQQELYLKELNPFKDKRYGNVTLFVDPNSEMYFTRKEKVFKSKTQVSEVASQINKRANNPNLYFVAPLTYEYDEIVSKDSSKKMPVLKLFMPFPEENLETELVERIRSRKPFSNKEITYLMYDLLHGFYHLQFLGFSHCKFGPEFVAKTTTGYAILDDPLHYPFDPIDLKKKKDWYLSPEAYKTALMGRKAGKDYSLVKADVFGLGLVILEAAIQMNIDEIYGHPSEQELDLDALNHLIEILKARYPENNLLVSTLKKMLTVSMEQRPDFFEMFDRMPPYEMIKNYFENLPMTQEERQSMRNSIHGSHALEAKDAKVFARTRPDDTKYMKYSSIKNSRYIENLDNGAPRRGANLERPYRQGLEMMIKSEVVEKDVINEKIVTAGNSHDEDLSMYKRSDDDRERSVISSFSNLKPKIAVKIQKTSPKSPPIKRPPTPKKKKDKQQRSSSNLHGDNLLANKYLNNESEQSNNISFVKEEIREKQQQPQQPQQAQQQQAQNMFNLNALDISALVQQKVKEELDKLTKLREKEDEIRREREKEDQKLKDELRKERELMQKQRLEGERQKELMEQERILMEKHRLEAEKHKLEVEKQRKELEEERNLMKKQRLEGEKQKEELQREKDEIAKLKAELAKKQEMLELKSKEVSIQHQFNKRNSSLKKTSSRNETEHNSTVKSPESKTMQASPYRSYNMKSIEDNRERSVSKRVSPRREPSKPKLIPVDEDNLDLPDGWAQEGKYAITPSGIKVQKMIEIGYRRSRSGREIEFQQVKWRKISKEEEGTNAEDYIQKKKQIQNTLKTPEKKIQPAIFVESRSPTPDSKIPVDFNKNYFSSTQQNQYPQIHKEHAKAPMMQRSKWNARSVQRSETPKSQKMNPAVMNKQQILNGIEGKIKRLTPSKSFNMSVNKGERPNTFQNNSINYNSTNALKMPQFSTGGINQNIINTQPSPKAFHDAYGNFPPRQRAPVSPYRKADRTASKSPQRSPKLVSENVYPLKSHQQSMIFDKENSAHDANIKIMRKPTLQNHFTLKDKERNGIKHHEPSFVEDSNIFTRERRPETSMNTRVTKQGILITRNPNTNTNTANVSVNHFDKSPEIYDDYKGGAIIPINNLNDDSQDFVDFDELNTPNIQKHFSLNHKNPSGHKQHQQQHHRAPELRGQRSQYINYKDSKDPAFYKNSRHGGSYHYTFKGRDSSKKGGIESGYNNEWINEEPEGITIYSQNDGYHHEY